MTYVTPQLFIDRLSPLWGGTVTVLLLIGIAVADYATGYALRLSVLYLLPISLAAWTTSLAIGSGVAIMASLLWLFSFQSEHFYQYQAYYFWEAIVMLCGFLAVAWLSARLRQVLSQADERFVRVLEEMRAAVYVLDEGHGKVLYANPEMARLLGGAAILDIREFELRFHSEATVKGIDTSPVNIDDFTTNIVKDSKTGRWYLLQGSPIPWGSNPQVKLKVLTDFTEQKEAERLRQSHLQVMHRAAQLTTLAETASTLAHEINQPLMVIATYTDACQRLIDSQDFDRAEISLVLGKCHAQAVRAASIIERLREFIRQRQPKPTPCEMTSLIKTAIDIVQPQLDEARVLIGCSKEVPSIVIDTDKTLLVQALVNLLRNAIDAVRDQPVDRRQISLCVIAGDSDEFIFSIADTGPGLSPEVKNKIFTPFFTTKADGLGLGLSICHSVAAAHGGNLWAENNPEGGVTFYLSLPRKSA